MGVALNIDLPLSVFEAAGNNGCGSGLKTLFAAAVAGRSVGMFFLDML
jgi:hypothetical protein